MLAGDLRLPVTEVALAVGYETPSAFNRVFRAALGASPTRFRTASPALRRRLLARLEDPRRSKAMQLDLTAVPEFRERPEQAYFHVTRVGDCAEEASGAWAELNRIVAATGAPGPAAEFIGTSLESPAQPGESTYVYTAGFTAPPGAQPPAGLASGTAWGGRYAVFRYRGSYRFIWQAVDHIFRTWVAKGGITLRAAPLIEVYLNDPRETPEPDLLTDLCLPVE